MATISARIDDELKEQAEDVTARIGISLSSAITIFLKQFVARGGFPFDVTVPPAKVGGTSESPINGLILFGDDEEEDY